MIDEDSSSQVLCIIHHSPVSALICIDLGQVLVCILGQQLMILGL